MFGSHSWCNFALGQGTNRTSQTLVNGKSQYKLFLHPKEEMKDHEGNWQAAPADLVAATRTEATHVWLVWRSGQWKGPNLSSHTAGYNAHSQGNSTSSYQSGAGATPTWTHNKKKKKKHREIKARAHWKETRIQKLYFRSLKEQSPFHYFSRGLRSEMINHKFVCFFFLRQK